MLTDCTINRLSMKKKKAQLSRVEKTQPQGKMGMKNGP
jgi:hypothetical protein